MAIRFAAGFVGDKSFARAIIELPGQLDQREDTLASVTLVWSGRSGVAAEELWQATALAFRDRFFVLSFRGLASWRLLLRSGAAGAK